MHLLQSCLLVCVVLLLALVNLLPNTAYKGMRHPVEADVVQVFATTPKLTEPEVPVYRFDDAILPEDTGQRVVVFLNRDYQGRELWNKPRTTLWIMGFAVPLCCLVGIVGRRSVNRRPPPA